MTTPAPLYCANHPEVETSLRCNRCEKPICPRCAVHTPTGYRCRECVRGQQKKFENSQWMDYVFGSLVGFVLSAIAAFLVIFISSVTGFFAWFIIAAASPAVAAGIAEALRLVTRRHRSKGLFIALISAVALGILPAVLFQVLTFNLWGLLFLGIYVVMAVPTVYYRLSGMKLFRR
jgi:hypothetical protein